MRLRSTEKIEQPFVAYPEDEPRAADEFGQSGELEVDPLIAVLHAPQERLAIQARDIQTSLSALRLPNGKRPTSIALIAVDAHEAAAVLTANVAVCAALNGTRTLLVDMAQSGFMQHQLLRSAPQVTEDGDSDDLYALIQSTPVTSLSLMAMPSGEEKRGETVALSPFADRLAPLSSHFDLCLVDASHVDDLALAACSAEAVILAVRRDGTTTARLKSTINKLAMLNAPLIGTVMFV